MFGIKDSRFWTKVERVFRNELNERYAELRKDILTKKNVLSKMNDFYKLIDDETLERDYQKWKNKPKYERNYLSSYLDDQIKYCDKEFEKK